MRSEGEKFFDNFSSFEAKNAKVKRKEMVCELCILRSIFPFLIFNPYFFTSKVNNPKINRGQKMDWGFHRDVDKARQVFKHNYIRQSFQDLVSRYYGLAIFQNTQYL